MGFKRVNVEESRMEVSEAIIGELPVQTGLINCSLESVITDKCNCVRRLQQRITKKPRLSVV